MSSIEFQESANESSRRFRLSKTVKRAAAALMLSGSTLSIASTLSAPQAAANETAGPGTAMIFAYNDGATAAEGINGIFGAAPDVQISGVSAVPDGQGVAGFDLVSPDGAVYSFNGVANYGSMAGKELNAPIVGIASTPDGKGYWEVAADGGIFSFGDANFYGSMGGEHLNSPVVGIAPTVDGKGYWEVAADGGVFSFGDANFYGSMGGDHLNSPVVSMAATADSEGYWLAAKDGGVFAFGDAHFDGSLPQEGMTQLNNIVGFVAVQPSIYHEQYALVTNTGATIYYAHDAVPKQIAEPAIPQGPQETVIGAANLSETLIDGAANT